MEYIKNFLSEVSEISKTIDPKSIDQMIQILVEVRKNEGRVFFLGVGGSAANCTHAVNDFRKLAGIECYSATDNVAELTARTNDEGWETVFKEWLTVSKLGPKDALFILSVGGGSLEKKVSVNLVNAIDLALQRNSKIIGIVGRDGGYVAKKATAHVLVPTKNHQTITPQAEGWQGVIWHLMVSDPRLLKMSNKWESLTK